MRIEKEKKDRRVERSKREMGMKLLVLRERGERWRKGKGKELRVCLCAIESGKREEELRMMMRRKQKRKGNT